MKWALRANCPQTQTASAESHRVCTAHDTSDGFSPPTVSSSALLPVIVHDQYHHYYHEMSQSTTNTQNSVLPQWEETPVLTAKIWILCISWRDCQWIWHSIFVGSFNIRKYLKNFNVHNMHILMQTRDTHVFMGLNTVCFWLTKKIGVFQSLSPATSKQYQY